MKAKANAVSVSLSLGRRSLERGREGEERWTRRTARRLDKAERVANVSGCVCVVCRAVAELQSSKGKLAGPAKSGDHLGRTAELRETKFGEKENVNSAAKLLLRNYYCEIIIPITPTRYGAIERLKPFLDCSEQASKFYCYYYLFSLSSSPPLTATQN